MQIRARIEHNKHAYSHVSYIHASYMHNITIPLVPVVPHELQESEELLEPGE